MEEEVLEKTGFVFEIYHVEWKHSPHSHDHYELFYQLNGVSSQKIDNCVYNVDKGDFILIPPNVVHETNVNGTRILLQISKKFLFKNKERNLIDSIAVNISVADGNVTVYPFVIEMDRYRAAVGGTQDMDMNFDYHISVLKSPIPIKFGLNIRGNLDDMKFGIGKAKYKNAVTPVEIRKVDSTIVNMGQQIVQDFRKVIRRRE